MNVDMPGQRQCLAALDKAMAHCPGIVAGMFALRDGRCYAERSRSRVAVGKFAAMSSSLMALSSSVMAELAADTPGYLLIEGSTHKLVACRVPHGQVGLIVAILAQSEVSLGLVLGYARTCAREVSEAEAPAPPLPPSS